MLDSPAQEIKERLSILEVIQDYVALKKAGTNYKGLCPFHNEKTPSFMVSPSKQIWHCFGCGLGGDVFEFVKNSENVDFGQALKMLADRAGVELRKPTATEAQESEKKNVLYDINQQAADYFEKVLWESNASSEARTYLRQRGLTDQTIKHWQLGFAPDDFHYLEHFLSKNFNKKDIEQAGLIIKKEDGTYFDRFRDRVMFPIINLHGQVVGFTGRLLHDKPNTGKYINSPETPIYNKSRVIYGFFQAKNTIRKENRCVLVEGNMDVISSHQGGFTQTVASSGTAFTLEQLQALQRFCENLIFAFDQDTAGSQATRRVLELALSLGFNVKIVQMQASKDPDELIRKGIGLGQQTLDSSQNYLDYFFEELIKTIDAQSVEGKREITKQLVPLIFRIGEPVTKAHYVRKLSNTINVNEQTIWDLIAKVEPGKSKPQSTPGAVSLKKKSRREILEEQLLGLSLYLKSKQLLQDFTAADFSPSNFPSFQVLSKVDDYSFEHLKASHPDLMATWDLLSFVIETEAQEPGFDPKSEAVRVASELKKLVVRLKMQQLSEALILAERAKDKSLVSKLSQQYQELTKQMQ